MRDPTPKEAAHEQYRLENMIARYGGSYKMLQAVLRRAGAIKDKQKLHNFCITLHQNGFGASGMRVAGIFHSKFGEGVELSNSTIAARAVAVGKSTKPKLRKGIPKPKMQKLKVEFIRQERRLALDKDI